jgi:hypothetical protein
MNVLLTRRASRSRDIRSIRLESTAAQQQRRSRAVKLSKPIAGYATRPPPVSANDRGSLSECLLPPARAIYICCAIGAVAAAAVRLPSSVPAAGDRESLQLIFVCV